MPGGVRARLGRLVGAEREFEIISPRPVKSEPAFAVWELTDFSIRGQRIHGRACDEICKVCFWEDDGQDDHDADDVRGGPNGTLSLRQARLNFGVYGASDRKFVSNVRPPSPDEL